MIQVMVVEERITERMSGMMPRSKYDVDYIINTITEKLISNLKKIILKQVLYSLVIFKKLPITSVHDMLASGDCFPIRFHL